MDQLFVITNLKVNNMLTKQWVMVLPLSYNSPYNTVDGNN